MHGFGERPHSKSRLSSAESEVCTALTRCVPNEASCNADGTASYSESSALRRYSGSYPWFCNISQKNDCGVISVPSELSSSPTRFLVGSLKRFFRGFTKVFPAFLGRLDGTAANILANTEGGTIVEGRMKFSSRSSDSPSWIC